MVRAVHSRYTLYTALIVGSCLRWGDRMRGGPV